MCSFRKNPYPPHGRPSEITKGRGGGGGVESQNFRSKVEFPGGRGGAKTKQKKPSMTAITQDDHRSQLELGPQLGVRCYYLEHNILVIKGFFIIKQIKKPRMCSVLL